MLAKKARKKSFPRGSAQKALKFLANMKKVFILVDIVKSKSKKPAKALKNASCQRANVENKVLDLPKS